MKLTKQIISFESGINAKTASNILPIKNAEMTYNFDFSDGSLKSSCGFCGQNFHNLNNDKQLDLSLAISNLGQEGAIFYYKKYDFENKKWADKIIVFDDEFNMFYINLFDENATLVSLNFKFSAKPFGVNYRLNSEDVFILASSEDSMIVWNGVDALEIIADAPKISSMVVHYERLFVTTVEDSSELWFSDDLDPSNWNLSLQDAGFIQMADERGSLRKVISFNNYVYVFRDFGISRLSASGGQESFYLSHLFVSSGKIFEKSISVCGDRIIFVATDGIYQFDGINTTKILENISNTVIANNFSRSCFFEGNYYLSCKVDFGDENYLDSTKNINALFVMDATSKEYKIIRGFEIVDMVAVLAEGQSKVLFSVKENQYLVEMDQSGEFCENSQKRVWRSALSDFLYPNKLKTIRCVHLYSKGSASLTITSEKESVTLTLSEGVNSYPLLVSGKMIKFEIYSEDADVEISDIVLEINV